MGKRITFTKEELETYFTLAKDKEFASKKLRNFEDGKKYNTSAVADLSGLSWDYVRAITTIDPRTGRPFGSVKEQREFREEQNRLNFSGEENKPSLPTNRNNNRVYCGRERQKPENETAPKKKKGSHKKMWIEDCEVPASSEQYSHPENARMKEIESFGQYRCLAEIRKAFGGVGPFIQIYRASGAPGKYGVVAEFLEQNPGLWGALDSANGYDQYLEVLKNGAVAPKTGKKGAEPGIRRNPFA